MSTIKADNIATLAGVSTSMANAVNGSAKAWVNFNGQFGSSPYTLANGGIRAAYNVDSVTDNGTGDYTINFTSGALPDGKYCPQLSSCYGSSSSIPESARQFVTGSLSATSVRMRVGYVYTSPTVADSAEVFVAVFR